MNNDRKEFEAAQLDFRGGVVSKVASYMLLANQVAKAEDTVLHRGGLRKNSGHSAALTSVAIGSKGMSIFRGYDMRSGTFTVAQFANGKLYRQSGARLALIGSGWGSQYKLSYAMANRKMYFANGGVTIRGWSGNRANAQFTPAATPATVVAFLYYHQDSNRLFAGHGAGVENRTYFSDINAFETWPTNNFFDIPESRMGDQVMGYSSLMGKLVIFGQRTVSVLYGRTPSDYQLRTLEWHRGCRYPMTIVSMGDYIMYVSLDGIYKFDGSGGAVKVSDPIDTILSDIKSTDLYGPAAMRSREGHYVLSYKSNSENTSNHVLNNDREIVAIPPSPEAPYWHFQGPNKRGFSYYSRFEGVDDSDQTYAVAGDTVGQIYKLEAGQTYNGTGIDMVVETRQYDLDSPFVRKRFIAAEFHAEAEANYYLQVQYKIDNEANWRDFKSISLDKSGPTYGDADVTVQPRNRVIYRALFDERNAPIGNYIQFRFRQNGQNGKNQPVNILGLYVCAAALTKLRNN